MAFKMKGSHHYGTNPLKQTQSGRGNIFTKKGRTQRLVNKHARLTDKQLESAGKLDEYGTVRELNKFGRISNRKERLEKKLDKKGISQEGGGYFKTDVQTINPETGDAVSTISYPVNPKQNKSPLEKQGCDCWSGYSRVPGTKPCAPGSCKKNK